MQVPGIKTYSTSTVLEKKGENQGPRGNTGEMRPNEHNANFKLLQAWPATKRVEYKAFTAHHMHSSQKESQCWMQYFMEQAVKKKTTIKCYIPTNFMWGRSMYLDSLKKINDCFLFCVSWGKMKKKREKISMIVFLFCFSLGKMKKKLQQAAQQQKTAHGTHRSPWGKCCIYLHIHTPTDIATHVHPLTHTHRYTHPLKLIHPLSLSHTHTLCLDFGKIKAETETQN